MPKLKRANDGVYLIFCLGCNCHHGIWVDKPNDNKAQWTFDGNMENPTFSPSLLIREKFSTPGKADYVCHSFIRNGSIQYLNDCTHKLAGQTVELPDLDTI